MSSILEFIFVVAFALFYDFVFFHSLGIRVNLRGFEAFKGKLLHFERSRVLRRRLLNGLLEIRFDCVDLTFFVVLIKEVVVVTALLN